VGNDRFANLGVNGLHPAAARGLVRRYGSGISGKGVIVHFNPLWIRSPVPDLSRPDEGGGFRPHHVRLLDQFDRGVRNYPAGAEDRIAAAAEGLVPFLALKNHLRTVYFGNRSSGRWAVENPYRNPLGPLGNRDRIAELVSSSRGPHTPPVPWNQNVNVVGGQNFPWTRPAESYQWYCFRDLLRTLKARNNEVFVLFGPFNPHIMTPESLERYRSIRAEMTRWMSDNRVACHVVPDLPSEFYPDASHVMKAGYVRIAEALLADPAFQKWMQTGPP
jgi:hypothetical protein